MTELFQEKWRAISTSDPLKSVVSGGALASSMAEVFMAGYQTAMRQSFGFDGPDWAAFCVSEGADGYPPVTINEDGTLSGYKTWVAAAAVTQQFLLKVGRGAEARYLVLARDAPGLTIEMKAEAEFLPELGVGRLALDHVFMGPALTLDRSQLKAFPKIEAGCILLAFLGFLQANGQRDVGAIIETLGPQVMAEPLGPALKELALAIQNQLVGDSDLDVSMRYWERDRRLIDQYLKMLA